MREDAEERARKNLQECFLTEGDASIGANRPAASSDLPPQTLGASEADKRTQVRMREDAEERARKNLQECFLTEGDASIGANRPAVSSDLPPQNRGASEADKCTQERMREDAEDRARQN